MNDDMRKGKGSKRARWLRDIEDGREKEAGGKCQADVGYCVGLYASDFHLPALSITRSETFPPAARVDPPPIRRECSAKYFGSRPDFLTTPQNARRAIPQNFDFTTATVRG